MKLLLVVLSMVFIPVIVGLWIMTLRGLAICSHPMPDENFVWLQCSTPCAWCDYMSDFARHSEKSVHPYRNHE